MTDVEGLTLCVLLHIAGSLTTIATEAETTPEMRSTSQTNFLILAGAVESMVANQNG